MSLRNLKDQSRIHHHSADWTQYLPGPHANLTNVDAGLSGCVTNIYGNASGSLGRPLYGSVKSELSGDVTGVFGNCDGKIGDLDQCGITQWDRENGVNIANMVGGDV